MNDDEITLYELEVPCSRHQLSSELRTSSELHRQQSIITYANLHNTVHIFNILLGIALSIGINFIITDSCRDATNSLLIFGGFGCLNTLFLVLFSNDNLFNVVLYLNIVVLTIGSSAILRIIVKPTSLECLSQPRISGLYIFGLVFPVLYILYHLCILPKIIKNYIIQN